ncbi:MAG: hypothetical protein ANABAC_1756 [Anaerolineae bacterium]|nr:MAG: hypothetical protein ANABAC_1756 [Anaerolineae bacterium]
MFHHRRKFLNFQIERRATGQQRAQCLPGLSNCGVILIDNWV